MNLTVDAAATTVRLGEIGRKINRHFLSHRRLKTDSSLAVFRCESVFGTTAVTIFKSPPPTGTISTMDWLVQESRALGQACPSVIAAEGGGGPTDFGWFATDYVEGSNALEMLKQGRLSRAIYCDLVGRALRRLHARRMGAFGPCGATRPRSEVWRMTVLHATAAADIIAKSIPLPFDVCRLTQTASDIVRDGTTGAPPVLINGNPTCNSILLSSDRDVTFTNWRHARGDIGLHDLAVVSWDLDAMTDNLDRDEQLEAKRATLRGYGCLTLSADDYERVETGIHVFIYLSRMNQMLRRHQRGSGLNALLRRFVARYARGL